MTNEKVLGFKKEDADVDYNPEEGGYEEKFYMIDESKLVPVVSLEWLVNFCDGLKMPDGIGQEYRNGFNSALNIIKISAEKEVVKEAKK